jgi:transcriptional regulator GlxA family with amidase domain
MATKFVFLILPHVHILDLAGPDQALHEAIEYGADFSIEYCSTGTAIKTTGGLPLGKLGHFSAVSTNRGDFLIIPGAHFSYLSSPAFKSDKTLFAWINAQYKKGVAVCSICAGAFVLAECGLLNHISCTTHFKKTKELQKSYPAARVMENILFTEENGIYSSAGIASGIDLTLHIIEQLKGAHFAHKVARELVVYNRRNGSAAQESELLQCRTHIHTGIHAVQDFIIENIQRPLQLPRLAGLAHMSERNFTRVFRKETGNTVNGFINIIRKEKIKELLNKTGYTKWQVANKVGLKSERQVNRLLNQPQ